MPTSALLERVEKHIDRLDRALKDSEDLLLSLKRADRGDWIRQVHERLAASPKASIQVESSEQAAGGVIPLRTGEGEGR